MGTAELSRKGGDSRVLGRMLSPEEEESDAYDWWWYLMFEWSHPYCAPNAE